MQRTASVMEVSVAPKRKRDSMIHYVKGDIFESPAITLVNPVNCVGVMGKGLALEFKKRFPEMYRQYLKLCVQGKVKVGQLNLVQDGFTKILLFPTKDHWKNPSSLAHVEAGLDAFCQSYRELGIDSVAFPKLGCGCGGLKWEDVKALMEKYLEPLPIDVLVYE